MLCCIIDSQWYNADFLLSGNFEFGDDLSLKTVVGGNVYKSKYRNSYIRANNLSIPDAFFKVVIDIDGDSTAGIGFIIPHEECEYPVMSYAVSIDEVEKRKYFVESHIPGFANFPEWKDKKVLEIGEKIVFEIFRKALDYQSDPIVNVK